MDIKRHFIPTLDMGHLCDLIPGWTTEHWNTATITFLLEQTTVDLYCHEHLICKTIRRSFDQQMASQVSQLTATCLLVSLPFVSLALQVVYLEPLFQHLFEPLIQTTRPLTANRKEHVCLHRFSCVAWYTKTWPLCQLQWYVACSMFPYNVITL